MLMDANGPESGEQKPSTDTPPAGNLWNLALWKDALATIQSFATIVALIVGGYWTYTTFIMERTSFPHVKMSQTVQGRLVAPEWYWIMASITVENTGKYLVSIDNIDVRVQQISPLSDNISKHISETTDPAPKNQMHIPWPLICRYWRPFHRRIEPGESDTFEVEFLVPAWLKTIRVYTYLKNLALTEEVGWDKVTVFEMKGGADEKTSMDGLKTSDRSLCAIDYTIADSRGAGS
jgi:hypothetical protein